MKRPILQAEERKVLGKQVKKLRREGLLPANVYGRNLSSIALQVKFADFDAVFKEVGETGLVDLQVNGQTKPVLVKNLQMNYQNRTPLHVDFYQVNLKEKVKTMVPVVLVGEAKAVTDNVGMLLQTLSEVEVEALPDRLPENVEVPVEHLAALDEQITVEDLKAAEGVTILTDPSQVVAKIAELVVEEPEVPAEGEEAAGAAGEEKAGGEEASEEPKSEGETEEKKEE
jgi:large subunit ribosomal protein L25